MSIFDRLPEPSYGIQSPEAKFALALREVWDRFGDLQLLNDEGYGWEEAFMHTMYSGTAYSGRLYEHQTDFVIQCLEAGLFERVCEMPLNSSYLLSNNAPSDENDLRAFIIASERCNNEIELEIDFVYTGKTTEKMYDKVTGELTNFDAVVTKVFGESEDVIGSQRLRNAFQKAAAALELPLFVSLGYLLKNSVREESLTTIFELCVEQNAKISYFQIMALAVSWDDIDEKTMPIQWLAEIASSLIALD